MSSNLKTAIIPAAGYGTRMLPVTKVISKEMLPVGNKPIIDYVVDDLIAAGIERIVIVVKPDEKQIKDYYSEESELKDYLDRQGKPEKYESVESLPGKAEFVFAYQQPDDPYGTTIPLLKALEVVGDDEPIIFVYGDAMPWKPGGKSLLKPYIKAWEKSGAVGAMLGLEVPKDQVSAFGVVETDANDNFVQIVEKPAPEDAPSNIINIGGLILPTGVHAIAEQTQVDEGSGEYYITDVVNQLVEDGVYVHALDQSTHFLDVGTPASFARSNRIVAEADL